MVPAFPTLHLFSSPARIQALVPNPKPYPPRTLQVTRRSQVFTSSTPPWKINTWSFSLTTSGRMCFRADRLTRAKQRSSHDRSASVYSWRLQTNADSFL
ncbi:unnamed protein product [Tetraodon nigroviridis]|uniref:(spotted green pufferfish) hypothetical protein n=1 Tax=Tetraodon nigroviridis TaxID=99883 RepID=Q4SLP5_TETNG|nr:unnamed protein product [Tetraodon nigroviridis]